MKNLEEWVRKLITPGTALSAFFYGLLGIITAFLLLFLGLPKTIFIALLCALGLFIGGVKNKPDYIKGIVNRLFPPRGKSN